MFKYFPSILCNVVYGRPASCPSLILAEQIKYKLKLGHACSLHLKKNLWNTAQNIVQNTYTTKTLQHNSSVPGYIKPLDSVVSVHIKTSMYMYVKPGHWAGFARLLSSAKSLGASKQKRLIHRSMS